MAAPRVLLLGGHGKLSLLMTPLMLARSWSVTSVIRDPSQETEILALGKGKKGKVDVLISSLEDVKSDADAKKILDSVQPNYVVWSAGAGGKGGYERTYAIDRDAAKHFIASSAASPSVSKFLLISYNSSRRNRAPWWNEEEWAAAQQVNNEVLPHYYKAKVVADEYQTAWAKKRKDGGDTKFQSINLRPGHLKDEPGTGKVTLGRGPARGSIPRADVAEVTVALLERDDTRGWYDLLGGTDSIADAVNRVVKEGVDCVEGEDLEAMYSQVK